MGVGYRALQIVIGLAALVPIVGGGLGVVYGPSMGYRELSLAPGVDSHWRYLSGLLLGIGLSFWALLPTLDRQGPLVRALAAIVFVGGLARAAAVPALGAPDMITAFALVMELLVTPGVALWHWRLVRARANRRRPGAD